MDGQNIGENPQLDKVKQFEALKQKVSQETYKLTQRRVAENPYSTPGEFYRGCFDESQQPQVKDTVFVLYDKGYITDPGAGFWGRAAEQNLSGMFHLSVETIESLSKIGVMVIASPYGHTLIRFNPDSTDIEQIKKKWDDIASIIPQNNGRKIIPYTQVAHDFRTTYLPQNDQEKKYHLFMKLRDEVYKKRNQELANRKKNNPTPTEEELRIGAYYEELEGPVRDAVFTFSRKGYTTDSSGFCNLPYATEQVIDGFFTLDEDTIQKIKTLGAKYEQSQNRYSHISFDPDSADEKAIKAKWDTISELLPDKGAYAKPSTSVGAENFRKEHPIVKQDKLLTGEETTKVISEIR